MSDFVEVVYFTAPEADRAYRRWAELHADALGRVPVDAVRVEIGRDRDDGVYVRVRARREYAHILDE